MTDFWPNYGAFRTHEMDLKIWILLWSLKLVVFLFSIVLVARLNFSLTIFLGVSFIKPENVIKWLQTVAIQKVTTIECLVQLQELICYVY